MNVKFNLEKPALALGIAIAGLTSGASALAQQVPELSDTDGDGIISAAEIKAVMDARKQATLLQFDADGNGELSRDERRVMKDARYDALLQQFDADGDGELSSDERQASREARRTLINQQLDVNQDGEVSQDEGAGFAEIRSDRKGGDGGRKHSNGNNENRDSRRTGGRGHDRG